MSENVFSETTSTGWLSRIGSSIKGVLVGGAMVVAAFPVLFMNEGCAVRVRKDLDQGSAAVVAVSSEKVDGTNEGKLVHMSGNATAEGVLEDSAFKVRVEGLKMKRVVEMYQWRESQTSETKKKLGGSEEKTVTYKYDKVWEEGRIKSEDFKKSESYSNPQLRVAAKTWQAKEISLGDFTLNAGLAGKLQAFEPVSLVAAKGEADVLPYEAKLMGSDYYYVGKDFGTPEVGDLKVSFAHVVSPTMVSVVAQQRGKSFEAFTGDSGTSIEMLELGDVSAEKMFAAAHSSNNMRTWLVRGGGFALMFMGFGMVFKPLSIVADVLPIAGTIVGVGGSIVAFLLAAPLSLITISLAWIVYRPLVGIPLLVVALVGFFLLFKKMRAAKAA